MAVRARRLSGAEQAGSQKKGAFIFSSLCEKKCRYKSGRVGVSENVAIFWLSPRLNWSLLQDPIKKGGEEKKQSNLFPRQGLLRGWSVFHESGLLPTWYGNRAYRRRREREEKNFLPNQKRGSRSGCAKTEFSSSRLAVFNYENEGGGGGEGAVYRNR